MRIIGLVLVLALVLGGACFATTSTKTLFVGWNLVSTPIAQYPDNATVAITFANILTQWTGGRNCVYGMNPAAGQYVYNPLSPGSFAPIQLGDAFMVRVANTGTTVTYTGFPSGLSDGLGGPETDMWISLPGNGASGAWHYVGQPFDHDTKCVDISFTDGTTVKSWVDASATGAGKTPWVSKTMTGQVVAGGFTVGPGLGVADDRLRAGLGYQMKTLVPNIAMIVPALPAY